MKKYYKAVNNVDNIINKIIFTFAILIIYIAKTFASTIIIPIIHYIIKLYVL